MNMSKSNSEKTEHRRETSFESNTSNTIFRNLIEVFPVTWLYSEKKCQINMRRKQTCQR